MMDIDDNGTVSRREMEVASNSMIEKMCMEGPTDDLAGWLRRTTVTPTSKADLFALLDRNTDGQLSVEEY